MNLVLSPEETSATDGGGGHGDVTATDFRRWLSRVQAALSIDRSADDESGKRALRGGPDETTRTDLSAPDSKSGHTT